MLIQYFGPGDLIQDPFFDQDGELTIQPTDGGGTSLTVVNTARGITTTFVGTGLPTPTQLANGQFTGTITGWTSVNGTTTMANVTGISWSVAAFMEALAGQEEDDESPLLALLNLQDITLDASDATTPLDDIWFEGVTRSVTIIGSDFGDNVGGGDGNDVIDLGLTAADEGDVVFGSLGSDQIIFSDREFEGGWFELIYADMETGGGLNVQINGAANTGTISAGWGTDTLVDVFKALRGEGLTLEGTRFNDSFTVNTGTSDAWMQIDGGAGADSYHLTLASDIRLSFSGIWSEMRPTQGANINIATGQILNDGFGNAETLTVIAGTGRLQVKGTSYADSITGGAANEVFLVTGGNDTINGGGGFDLLRFDRSDVQSAVTVNLAVNSAQFVGWGGIPYYLNISQIEDIRGSGFADHLSAEGTNAAVSFEGRNGNDTLRGGDGDDELMGDAGNDSLEGGLGDDYLEGGDGNDHLVAGLGNDHLEGGDGDDTLDASADPTGWGDYILPGLGSNTILGSQTLYQEGQDGIDLSYDDLSGVGGLTITVGANGTGSTVSGIAGMVNDTFTWAHFFIGSQDDDSITVTGTTTGWEGFRGDAGNDTINGGSDFDEVDYRGEADWHDNAQGVVVNFATSTAIDTFGDTDTLINIESIRGTHLADSVTARNAADAFLNFRGYDGADTLTGSTLGFERADYSRDADDDDGSAGILADLAAGTIRDGFGETDVVSLIDAVRGTAAGDTITGGNLAEELEGLGGNDRLYGGAGNDTLEGEIGNDRLEGGAGADTLDGGAGNDSLYGDGNHDWIAGGAGNDLLRGGTGNETIYGDENEDRIYGEDGHDWLDGGGGADSLYGEAGNDSLFGGGNHDRMAGGDGNDSLAGGTGNETIYGNNGEDVLQGDEGHDLAYGGLGLDTIRGGTGNDSLYGGEQGDTLSGNDGNDVLSGDGNLDVIYGGAGDDTLLGGSGSDTLSGGAGADVFVFATGGGRDTITDFAAGEDRIDLSAFAGLTWIGTDPFSGQGGEVRYNAGLEGGTYGRISIDLSGSGKTEFAIDLTGSPVLDAGDFIL